MVKTEVRNVLLYTGEKLSICTVCGDFFRGYSEIGRNEFVNEHEQAGHVGTEIKVGDLIDISLPFPPPTRWKMVRESWIVREKIYFGRSFHRVLQVRTTLVLHQLCFSLCHPNRSRELFIDVTNEQLLILREGDEEKIRAVGF